METNVFIGIPSHNGDVRGELIAKVLDAATGCNICLANQKFSKLTQNFNLLLCAALNAKRHTHFCMVHADIVPESGWLPKMLRIMDENKADILSVVMPLKTSKGITSTGLCEKESEPLMIKRFTLKEIHNMPPTFTHEHLIINTGLMLIDLRATFVKHFGDGLRFRVTDQIIREADGNLRAYGAPEDWLLSLDARKLGAKIYATREVTASHVGSAFFHNNEPYGIEQEGWNRS